MPRVPLGLRFGNIFFVAQKYLRFYVLDSSSAFWHESTLIYPSLFKFYFRLLIMLPHTWARPELPRIFQIFFRMVLFYCITWSGYGPKRPRLIFKEESGYSVRTEETKKKQQQEAKLTFTLSEAWRGLTSRPMISFPFRGVRDTVARFSIFLFGGASVHFLFLFF